MTQLAVDGLVLLTYDEHYVIGLTYNSDSVELRGINGLVDASVMENPTPALGLGPAVNYAIVGIWPETTEFV